MNGPSKKPSVLIGPTPREAELFKTAQIPSKNQLCTFHYGGLDIPVISEHIDKTYGEYDSELQQVTINPDATLQRQRKTFLHEAVEVVDCEGELKLSHPQITGLETGLITLLGPLIAWERVGLGD